ncbi:MAG TPA: ClpXP protease specificity-enhancing factor [Chromatiales bacterium]|nr:ClpXP protease specificity-enhancing factor [Chromatiales bacterium]HEX21878.1 ClpXP protease specificity-enhancing factor [Chromatiales bacterium]
MTSSRPYLLRAIYEWIVDNGLTPYLLVNAGYPDVRVPVEHINNGKIILNVAPEAVQALDLGTADVSFNARFDGRPMNLFFPVAAVLAIYARENGRGMVFSDSDDSPPSGPPEPGKGDKPEKGKPAQPALRVVK